MKKFIYLSIVIATLSLSSFRSQDKLEAKAINLQKITVKENTPKTYVTFNSSVAEIGDPTRPPRD